MELLIILGFVMISIFGVAILIGVFSVAVLIFALWYFLLYARSNR